jgi:hypothetical protein
MTEDYIARSLLYEEIRSGGDVESEVVGSNVKTSPYTRTAWYCRVETAKKTPFAFQILFRLTFENSSNTGSENSSGRY